MNYRVTKRLGQGGFGIVERVCDDQGSEYARKRLNVAAFAQPDLPATKTRFEREVRYQEQVHHPNIVKIIEHRLDEDPPWFIMPLAVGSLADDIKSDRTLAGHPEPPLFDVLSGLQALHDKGFSHRDLKPGNVLKFRSEEGGFVYKISDFGLTTPGIGHTTTLTASNMAGGTPLYRAPECANNFRRATVHADIYSFGAILHDIFHGGPRTPHAKLTVPGALGPIVARCTEPKARHRFRSVATLREALYTALSRGAVVFHSEEEEDVINFVMNHVKLSEDHWERVFDMIEENIDQDNSNFNILCAISGDQIESLFDVTPDIFHGLGFVYATFAESQSFAFEYCDIVSDKADIFYRYGDRQLKARIALAMLRLGASHNRWRVENQFLRMAGPEIDDALAERIEIEINVQRVDFSSLMDHLFQSISANDQQLHPRLRKLLEEPRR